jgi:hypothetical protein
MAAEFTFVAGDERLEVRIIGSAQEFVKVCNWRGFQNPRGTGV